jgi:molybdate transport system substrate-binding protein
MDLRLALEGDVMRICIVLAAALALAVAQTARADEIKLLASGATQEIVQALLPAFEKSTGHKITATWTGTVKIKEQIDAGAVYDLVIVGAPEIDKYVAEGKLVAGSRVDIAKSGVGVAVKAGASKPDISSGEAVKKAMLAAKSVAYSTGPSGVYVQALIQKFGIAEEMKPKSKQTASGTRVGQLLARGEAELGFQQVSELLHESGIDFVGPLPADVQNYTNYSSGVFAAAKAPMAAKALQAHLSAPTAAEAIRKYGMEPAR